MPKPVEYLSGSETDHSLVTVVVPFYNRLQYLPQAIRSVLDQTHPKIQLIVVDDGSDVDSQATLEPFKDRIELYKKANGGLASARNLGIAHAKGEYLLFLDDDDFLEAGAVEALLTTLQSGSGGVWAAGRFAFVDAEGCVIRGRRQCLIQSGDNYASLVKECVITAPSSVLARTDVVREVGCFDESFRLSEDYDLWLALARDHPILATAEVVTNYRIHPAQISRTQSGRHIEFHIKVLRKQRARAREGFAEAFDKSIASLHFDYGDLCYLNGMQEKAREQWTASLPWMNIKDRFRLLPRFVKSFLPTDILMGLRKMAFLSRSMLRRSN